MAFQPRVAPAVAVADVLGTMEGRQSQVPPGTRHHGGSGRRGSRGRARSRPTNSRPTNSRPTNSRPTNSRHDSERELKGLLALTDTMLALSGLDAILGEALERVRVMLHVDNAAILLLDDSKQTLVLRAARGPEAPFVGQVRVPVGAGIAGTVIAGRHPRVANQLDAAEVMNPPLRRALSSLVAVPLIADGRALGVLHVATIARHRFMSREVKLVERVAARVALAIAHAEVLALAEMHSTRLEGILGAMGDAVLVYDSAGQIVHSNHVLATLLRFDADPLFADRSVGERGLMLNLRTHEGRPLRRSEWPVTRVLAGEELTGAQTVDFACTACDGQTLWFNATGTPLRARDGAIRGAVVVLRDVTARRAAEQERAQMLNLIAHDLRSPLTSVKLTVQALRRRVTKGRAISAEDFAEAEGGVARLEGLVRNLVDAARLDGEAGETLVRLPQDLRALCEAAAREQRRVSSWRIVTDFPTTPINADVDELSIRRVLANLLSNAHKHAPSAAPIMLSLTQVGERARIAVSDHGPGIPPEALPRLFQRFSQLSDASAQRPGSERGLGLGLYICRKLVERHGGEIGVESQVGQGSTFWFTVPMSVAAEHSSRR